MKRRYFIKTVGLSIGASLLCKPHQLFAEETIGYGINYPDEVSAIVRKLNSVMEDSIGGELPKYKVQIADHYKLNFLLQSA